MTDLDDDDALAAEYVIGTLDMAEREAAELRRRRDPDFERLIEAWERRLTPLLESVPSIDPGPRLRDAILADIGKANPVAANDNVAVLRREVRLWRSVAGVSVAAAVLLAMWGGSQRWAVAPPTTYMAVLQQGGAAPAFLVTLDLGKRTMTVLPSAASVQPDKSLQLWMVADPSAPHSLGLLQTDAPLKTIVPDIPADMISNATYAVTLEPKGGSPKPTSTPIYVGHLVMEPK